MANEKPGKKEQRAIAAELAAIRAADPEGLIKLKALVDLAANPASAAHQYFTWDDVEAAHKYRLSQAKSLIRSIEVPAPK